MSQHLKLLAPKFNILPATVDIMYDHPAGQVFKPQTEPNLIP